MKNIKFVLFFILVLIGSIYFVSNFNTIKEDEFYTTNVKKETIYPIEKFDLDNVLKSYKLNYKSIIETQEKNKNKQVLNTLTAGIFNIRFMEKKSNDNFLFLSNISQIVIKHGDEDYNKQLALILSKPFVFEITPNGEIVKTHFEINRDDADTITQLLEVLQIIIENQKEYFTKENSFNGVISSKYNRDINHFKKQRRSFLTYNDPDIDFIEIPSSNIDCSIDKDWIIDLESNEIFKTNIMEMDIKVNNKLLFQRLNDIDKSSPIWDMDYESFKKYNKPQGKVLAVDSLKEEKLKIFQQNDYKLEQLIDLLNKKFSVKNMDNLVQYFQLHPDEVPLLLEYIKNSDNNRLDALYIQILEEIGTVESQNLILEIIASDDFSLSNHLTGIFALNMIQKPTQKTIDFLWDLYYKRDNIKEQELSNTAILALGNISKNIDESSQKLIHEKLKEEYYFGGNSDKISSILLAMENAGSSSFKNEIYNGVQSSEMDIKASAIAALNKDNTDETKQILTALLKDELTYEVRTELAKTVSSVEPTQELMVQVQKKVYESSGSEELEYINYLHKYRKVYPQNISILKELRYSKNSSSDAKKLLARYGYSR